MGLCRKVLAWLIFWYRTNTLPHYFIPNQNLIGHVSKDMCKQVYDWLLYIRSDLWDIYMAFSDEDCAQDNILHPVGHSINWIEKMKRNSNSEPQQLVKELCFVQHSLRKLHDNFERLTLIRCLSTLNSFDVILKKDADLVLSVKQTANKLSLTLQYAEVVILPVIENMSHIVKAEKKLDTHIQMFTTVLRRQLGDYYLQNSVVASLEQKKVYIAKAVKYYSLGTELVHPDGWSDKELGGDIIIARLYYLNMQWDLLDTILTKFEGTVKTVKHVANFSPLVVHNDRLDMPYACTCNTIWQSDRKLATAISLAESHIYIHPLSLGYYMVCRSAHRQGDKAKVDEGLGNLLALSTRISKSVSVRSLDNFTKTLISIIQKLL